MTSFDFVKVILILPTLLPKLLDVGGKDGITSLSLLLTFLDKAVLNLREVLRQIKHAELLLLKLVALLQDLIAQLLQRYSLLDLRVTGLPIAHNSHPLHQFTNPLLFRLHIML